MSDADIEKLEYDIVIAELKEGKTQYGRKQKLSVEMYKSFLYWFRQTGLVTWSAAKSGMGIERYRRLREGSKTFRQAIERDSEDLVAVAMINLARSIRGTPAMTDAAGNKVPAIPPSVKHSQWYLTMKWRKEDEEKDEELPLGAPRTEREQELLLGLLNAHHDYVESKRYQSGLPTSAG